MQTIFGARCMHAACMLHFFFCMHVLKTWISGPVSMKQCSLIFVYRKHTAVIIATCMKIILVAVQVLGSVHNYSNRRNLSVLCHCTVAGTHYRDHAMIRTLDLLDEQFYLVGNPPVGLALLLLCFCASFCENTFVAVFP